VSDVVDGSRVAVSKNVKRASLIIGLLIVDRSCHDHRLSFYTSSMAGLVTWLVEALVEVARNDSVPEVQFFLSEGADVNGRDMHGRSAMHWSVIDGLQATTTLLLVCGANANESDTSGRGRSLLHKCVENGVENEGIAELLLLLGADIDAHNEMFQTPQDLAVLYHERHGLDDHLNLMLLLMSFRTWGSD
jgi:hypothetical protein